MSQTLVDHHSVASFDSAYSIHPSIETASLVLVPNPVSQPPPRLTAHLSTNEQVSSFNHTPPPDHVTSPRHQRQLPTPTRKPHSPPPTSRPLSNPFEILYGSASPHSRSLSPAPPNSVTNDNSSPMSPMSQKYLEIERSFQSAKSTAKSASKLNSPPASPPQKPSNDSHVKNSAPPIVTIIDQSSQLRRSGSVVSRSASLRSRNTIKRRNKMVRRTDLGQSDDHQHLHREDAFTTGANSHQHLHQEDAFTSGANLHPTISGGASSSVISPLTGASPSRLNASNNKKNTSTASKIKFLFPVKRKTSLKRKSKYTPLGSSSSAKFESRQELEDFFEQNNVQSLIRELLPHSMKQYDYDHLLTCNPKVKGTTKLVEYSTHDNSFKLIDPPAAKISSPLPHTFVKNPDRAFSVDRSVMGPPTPIPPPHLSRYPETHSRHLSNSIPVIEMIYNKYRAAAFTSCDTNKHTRKIPPRFYEIYPQERRQDAVLTPKEVDQLEKKLLLEVLLRRTVAAKIEYRLKQSGILADQQSAIHSSPDTRSTYRTPSSTTIENNSSSGPATSSASASPSANSSRFSSSSSSAKPSTYNTSKGTRRSRDPQERHRSPSNSDAKSTSSSHKTTKTDDLTQQNASTLSEFLPSPQISYSSDIFRGGLDPYHQPGAQSLASATSLGMFQFHGNFHSGTTSPLAMISEQSSPISNAATSSLQAAPVSLIIQSRNLSSSSGSKHTIPIQIKQTGASVQSKSSSSQLQAQDSSSSRYSSHQTSTNNTPKSARRQTQNQLVRAAESPSSLYVNDFNKAYYAHYNKPSHLEEVEEALFKSNVYQLKPMIRSNATLSTSTDGESHLIPASLLPDSFDSVIKSNTNRSDEVEAPGGGAHTGESDKQSGSEGQQRKSQSTANTSISQGLLDLSLALTKEDSIAELQHVATAKSPIIVEEHLPAINQGTATEFPVIEKAVPLNTDTSLGLAPPLKASNHRNSLVSQGSTPSVSLIDSLNKHRSTDEIELMPTTSSTRPAQTELPINPMADLKSMHGSIIKCSTESESSFTTALSSRNHSMRSPPKLSPSAALENACSALPYPQSPLFPINETRGLKSTSSSLTPRRVHQLSGRNIPSPKGVISRTDSGASLLTHDRPSRRQSAQLDYSGTVVSSESKLSFKSVSTERQFQVKGKNKRGSL